MKGGVIGVVITSLVLLISLNFVSSLSNVSACGNLTVAHQVYTLNKSIAAADNTGTCITISAINITLDCQSYNITFGNSTTGGWGVFASDAIYNGYNNVTIRNCKIYENTSGVGEGGIFFGASSGKPTVTNTTILTIMPFSYGIYIDNNSVNANISFNDISVLGTFSSGVYSGFGEENISIKSNNITTLDLNSPGIYFDNNSVNANVTSNSISTYGLNSYAIEFDANSSKAVVGWNNMSTSALASHVVYFDSAGNNATINSNNITAYQNGSSGILMGDNSANSTIFKNRIVIPGIIILGGLPVAGIFLETGNTRMNVSANNITTSGYIGVGVWVWASNSSIDKNNITSSGVLGDGIFLGEVTRVNVTSNRFMSSGTAAFGVYSILSENASHILYNNVITTSGATAYGTAFDQDSGTNFSSNNITTSGNASYAMFFNQSHNHILESNILTTKGSNSYVLYLETSGNETIYNNLFNTSTTGSGIYVISSDSSSYNITQATATNIIGRGYTGGNFYTNNESMGYSDNCPDSNGDFFCDPYVLTSGTDYYPLTNRSNMIAACAILSKEKRIYYLNNSITINGTCMNISANNVTLNLSSKVLTGNTTGEGINITYYNSSKILEGTISNFSNGIYISSSLNNTFTDVYISKSGGDAVLLQGADSDNNNFTGLVVATTAATHYDINISTEGIDGTWITDSLLVSYAFAGAGGTFNLHESDYGKIEYLEAINGSATHTSLADIVYIVSNIIRINSTNNIGLNRSANISIYGITYTDPKPQFSYDGTTYTDCTATTDPSCTELSFSGTTFIFNVSHFTTFKAAEAYVAPSSSSGGGGGSGVSTSSFWNSTSVISDEQFGGGYSKELPVKSRIRFRENNTYYDVGVVALTASTATVNVSSSQEVFGIGESRKFEVNNDSYYDILVTLNSIANNKANVSVLSIHDVLVPATSQPGENLPGTETAGSSGILNSKWFIPAIAGVVIVAAGLSTFFVLRAKKIKRNRGSITRKSVR